MQHDATTAVPTTRPARARDGIGDLVLRDFLAMHPGLVLETCICGETAVVDLLSVPERHRRRGLGSMAYALWERTLAQGMTVELFSVDERAAAFWRTLGFQGEDNGIMRRTVRRGAVA